ncbi:MAG: ASCH domain-containing protein [Parasphingorhabdus sp.]|uniref:ASCH domain-containing protein n=2 Tax=Parasphingorhabdus sp. TaxID=2709688 RepID=UPI0032646309
MHRSLWEEYCNATGINEPCPPADQFGDTPELGDELVSLVLKGQKQATCELKRWFDSHGHPLPKSGDRWIITDGSGQEQCIIETTQVDLCSVREVDEAFAWDEGEGDRSLAFWKAAHDAYYKRQAERDGFVYSDEMTCVCERFKLIWPAQTSKQ